MRICSVVACFSLAGLEKRQLAGRLALDTLTRRERVLGPSHDHAVAAQRLVTAMRGFAATYDPTGCAYRRLSGDDLSNAAGDCDPVRLAIAVTCGLVCAGGLSGAGR